MPLRRENLVEPFFGAMKPRSMWRVGTEAEKFGVDARTGAAIAYEGDRGVLAVLRRLEDRYGWTPIHELHGGPVIGVSRGSASVTLEPGGQLELSGAPADSIHALIDESRSHLAELERVSADLGLEWLAVGFHPFARPEDLPWVPKLRYAIMKEYLPRRGARALDMMRRTCTLQVNVDYESEEDAIRKLRLALKLTTIVTAMVANSPFFEGTVTGVRCERARVWLDVDPDRQGLLERMWNPRATMNDYVEWALEAPMFLFKRDGVVIANTGQTFRSFLSDGYEGHEAEMGDWELHLRTLFPEVRLKNTIELRGGDALPSHLAACLPALWTGILYDDRALSDAEALAERFAFAEIQALRRDVAKIALGARLGKRPLADVALQLIDIAKKGLGRRGRLSERGQDESCQLSPIASLVERGECPADGLVRGLPSDPVARVREIVSRTRA
jgi:glutamate--cysteine ligase